MNWLSIIILILMIAAVSATMIAMPFLSRKTVSFGISVSEEMYYSKEVAGMRRAYAWTTGVIQAVLSIAFALFMSSGQEGTLASIILPVYAAAMILSSMLIQLYFYFKMKGYKAMHPALPSKQEKLVIDTSFRTHKLVYSNWWFLPHLLIIAANVLVALMNYDLVPNMIPMKYSMDGEVIRSVEKSHMSVLFPNVMQVVLLLLFYMVNRIISRSKQQLEPGKGAASSQQNVLFRRRWSMYSLVSGFALILMFSFIQLSMFLQINNHIQMTVIMLVPALMILSALLLSFQTGQGGSRLDNSADKSGTMPVNDDHNWKLGNFYYNPNDPSLFVEKRMGVGWTMNYARPLAWLMLVAPFVIIILVITFLAP
ncbi:DUF1648 domain-containing protein [Paenibacillus sp. J22TS3]|uniref:DUF1648 domain-containing protein n=1 Tax=Paenibacillus sp. J22TS3 TaxID=2807192 RepID=UPI001B276D52|nr:DUF5808 domain-containing protein [Paenibacillus sp. J22TS3]GIP23684.1 membrane protein [Paenibacillus sp. J22TS3]